MQRERRSVLRTTFDTEDEAIRLANSTEYGLVAYVFTKDLNRGIRMGERLETGMLVLNAGVIFQRGRTVRRRQAVRPRT